MRFNRFQMQVLFAVLACAIAVPFTGCGGNSLISSPKPSTAVTAVSVTCSPSAVANGGTAQCTADVQGSGSYSPAVTWSASAGSISATGVLTAPATGGNVTVTAASAQQPSLTGSATLAIASTSTPTSPGTPTAPGTPTPPGTPTAPSTPSSITSVSVTCSPSSVNTGGTSHCTAKVQGSGTYSSAVAWSSTDGAVSSSGVFTAPDTDGDVKVTATSAQDTARSGKASIAVQLQVPGSRHVVMVMEENQSYSTVVGNSSAWPNLNNLIANGALLRNFYANAHPSIGNYLMLATGKVLTTDDNSTTVWNVDNIARRMLAAKIPFRVYAEGIAQGYVGGNTGPYLIRHNPFALLSDIADNATVAKQVIWPFSQFATDLADGTLPEFSFIVPDVNDDAHNGAPKQADSWLESNIVQPLSHHAAFQDGGDGLLIVGFDEAQDSDTTYGGGHVSPVLWGPKVRPGYQQSSSTVYQHQSTLRTIMEALGLPNPPAAAATAPSMSEFFVQP